MKIFCTVMSGWSSLRSCFKWVDDRFERLRRLPLVRIGLYSLFASWVLLSDPFGLSSAADKALSDQLGRFRAFVQPVAPAPVTVVAIDYPSIAGLNNDGNGWMEANDWPLTYADHGRILRDLALPKGGEAAPAAVFYDIFFERPRATSGDLGQLGRILKRLDADTSAASIHLAGGGSLCRSLNCPANNCRLPHWSSLLGKAVVTFTHCRLPWDQRQKPSL